MKGNEIMLGDWVRRRWTCTDTGREVVKDFQVGEVRKNWETLYVWRSEGGNMGAVEQIEPIPLTPEILEKNGWLATDEPMVEFFGVGKWDRKYKNIEYVHELQHALRLCGIEKEIEL